MALKKARLGKAPRRGAGDVTFGPFFLEWLDYAGAEWSPKTREVNRFCADRAISRFGHVPLSKITLELLDREKTYLLGHGNNRVKSRTAPLSPKSVKETFTLVKAALRQAKKWNRISVDPAVDLEVPTVKRRQIEIPQEDELESYLAAFVDAREYAFIAFAAGTGCRRGELCALQIRDVSFSTCKVEVNKSLEQTKAGLRVKSTKSGKPRSFELPDWLIPVLREQIAMIRQERELLGGDYEDNGLLFCERDGSYYKPDQIGGRINYLLKQAGVRSRLHGLRHFNASWQLSHKVPLPIVSERLGHANPAITLSIYSHVLKADDAAAAKALSGLDKFLPPGEKRLRPVLVTRSDTETPKTGTEDR